MLIYREEDLAECHKARRNLQRRRIAAQVGTKHESENVNDSVAAA
jgi:hypothetical protein